MRGNNIAGWTGYNTVFDSGQITVKQRIIKLTLTSGKAFNLTGFSRLNVQCKLIYEVSGNTKKQKRD